MLPKGAPYPASIQQDIMDSNGNVVIPRGSPATLIVRRMTEGGTLEQWKLRARPRIRAGERTAVRR